jgi:hypothetical protein
MLEQIFLEDGEWTGYFSMGFENPQEMDPSNDKFDPIGGDNEVVRGNGWDVLNPLYPGKIIERVVRFKVVERLETDENFRLKSNFFQSQEDSHVLEAIVFRNLGYMIFDHQNCAWGRKKEITAVITPFGIVGCAVRGTSWMWLWKSA